jgi:tRNA-splicing ligase RtcB
VKYGIDLPDKQLACAPIGSPEGQHYLAAMAAGANFAWANRQAITHQIRRSFMKVTGRSQSELGLHLVYDVAHNIAKIERHRRDGHEVEVCVHRKGATRAFPAGHPEVPARYRAVGQPVLVPGDMGRYSYLAVGTERAMAETWGSTCHGAGRVRSRGAAKRLLAGVDVAQRMAEQGIVVRAQNPRALAEEASEAYKDVADVIEVLEQAGISRKVARMRPLGVIKG